MKITFDIKTEEDLIALENALLLAAVQQEHEWKHRPDEFNRKYLGCIMRVYNQLCKYSTRLYTTRITRVSKQKYRLEVR